MEKRNQNEKKRSTTSMDSLPTEMITSIIKRLPIKSVVRCRSVCKKWCSIIDNPQFSIMHYMMMTRTSTPSYPSFILYDQFVCPKGNIYLLEDEGGTAIKSSSMVELKLDKEYYSSSSIFLVGSCCGLLFFSTICSNFWRQPHDSKDFMFIYNPATREYLKLPDITPPLNCSCFEVLASCGFGIDPISKEFKVVLIFRCPCYKNVHKDEIEIQVYTLGQTNKSWKKTRRVGHANIPFVACTGLFVNGSLHWIGNGMSFNIVSFDLGSEYFGIIPKPKFEFDENSNRTLGVLGGCLCLSSPYNSDDDQFEIWVMKDYNVRASWTKQFVITRRNIVAEIGCFDIIFPVFTRTNGEIVLFCDTRFLVSYNLESGKATILKHYQPSEFVYDNCFTSYIGSLISPKSAPRMCTE